MTYKLINRVYSRLTQPGIIKSNYEDKQVLVYRWARTENWVFIIFVGMIAWWSKGFSRSSLSSVIFLAVFAYMILVTLLNETVLEIIDDTLRVKHKPLPWFRNHVISVRDIKSVYREQMRARRGTYIYNVRVILDHNKGVTLFNGLDDPSEAQEIVTQIKKWLYRN